MKAKDCLGLTQHSAGQFLKELAKRVPSDQAIVELGVYTGRSLLYLAEGAAAGGRATVWGVDPWNLPRKSKPKYSDPKTYDYAMNAIAMSVAAETVSIIPVRDYGTAVARDWDGPPVGLLYIDADHRFQPVLDDFFSWQPHLAPGAMVCFDDYHSDFPGVIQAVDKLAAEGHLTEPYIPKGCERLAVTQWTG